MPVPSAITDLTTNAATNSPGGGESITTTDDYLRTQAAFIRQLHDGTTKPAWSAALRIPFFDASGNYATASDFVRDAAGSVGVGASVPSSKLEVQNSGDAVITVTGNTASGNTAGIDFKRNGGTVNAQIRSQSVGSNDAGEIYLGTRPAGGSLTERMRIGADGNIAIGATLGTWASNYRVAQVGYSAAFGSLSNDNLTFIANNIRFDGSVYRYITTGSGSYMDQYGGAHRFFTAPFASAGTAATLTQTMTLDGSGNLLVGNSTDLGAGVTQLADRAGRWVLTTVASNPSGGIYYHWNIKSGSANVGAVTTSATSTTYATSSDYRLKTDVRPMVGALASILSLRPVIYKWKLDGSDGEGFLAHELGEVCPQAVTGEKDATRIERVEISPAVPAQLDEDGNEIAPAVEAVYEEREVPVYQGIDTSFLVGRLVAAIQEQQALITDLQARVAALEAR